MSAVIFDIDGTLCDLTHRLHHVTGGAKNWDAFFAGVGLDVPHAETVELCKILANAEKQIILVSGRPESTRAATVDWMEANAIEYSQLFMRPDGDYRPDTAVKSQILDYILAQGIEIDFVVDDRPSVVKMWRERGLTCFQCRDWNERKVQKPKGLLTLMVGPSGAGKSTWLKSEEALFRGIKPSHIISSDQIREDLCGDFRDQSRNEDVFAAVHAIAKTRIDHGLPAVIDATNIKRKDRLACVDLSEGGDVRYVVVDRPMADKIRDAGWRKDVMVGDQSLIEKHAQTFASQVLDIIKGDGRANVKTVLDERVRA